MKTRTGSRIGVKRIARLTGHNGPVYALEKGRDRHLFLTGSADNMVAEWSLEELAPQRFAIKLETTVYSLCHIPERQLLLIGQGRGGIHAIDLEKKQEVRHLALHKSGIFDLKYSPRYKRFHALCMDGSLSTWSIDSMELIAHSPISQGKLRQMAFGQDDELFATACGDGLIRIFHTENRTLLHALKGHEDSVNTVAWHPNGKLLISGGKDARLRFWKIDEGFRLIRSIPAHHYAIYDLAFSPDGHYCATASRDKTVKIWDSLNFEVLARLDRQHVGGHTHSVNRLLWTDYKDYLLSTGDDRSIMVWQVEKNEKAE